MVPDSDIVVIPRLQKDLLIRIRKDAAREDFENRNSGSFKRIFPPDDKFRREKYATLVADAFNVFLSGRATSLQQEINRAYNNKYRVRLVASSIFILRGSFHTVMD